MDADEHEVEVGVKHVALGVYEAELMAPRSEGSWLVNVSAQKQRLFRDAQYALATLTPPTDRTRTSFCFHVQLSHGDCLLEYGPILFELEADLETVKIGRNLQVVVSVMGINMSPPFPSPLSSPVPQIRLVRRWMCLL